MSDKTLILEYATELPKQPQAVVYQTSDNRYLLSVQDKLVKYSTSQLRGFLSADLENGIVADTDEDRVRQFLVQLS